MGNKLETFTKTYVRKDLPDLWPGDTVQVYQKIREAPKKGKSSTGQERKEKKQVFEGLIIAKKHGKEMGATITVRKVISGIGVEKIFPIHSPSIEKIEILKRGKVRRAKLYYLRTAKGKRARLKRREFAEVIPKEPSLAKTPEGKGTPEEMKEEVSMETSPELKSETEKESKNESEKEK